MIMIHLGKGASLRLISENFEPLDMERVYLFAEKFSQKEKAQRYFDEIFGVSDKPGDFGL